MFCGHTQHKWNSSCLIALLKSLCLSKIASTEIHGELVLELLESEMEQTKKIVKAVMEEALQLDVLLVVNFVVGESRAK